MRDFIDWNNWNSNYLLKRIYTCMLFYIYSLVCFSFVNLLETCLLKCILTSKIRIYNFSSAINLKDSWVDWFTQVTCCNWSVRRASFLNIFFTLLKKLHNYFSKIKMNLCGWGDLIFMTLALFRQFWQGIFPPKNIFSTTAHVVRKTEFIIVLVTCKASTKVVNFIFPEVGFWGKRKAKKVIWFVVFKILYSSPTHLQ